MSTSRPIKDLRRGSRRPPVQWCLALLLSVFALQPPESVAVEEELRSPGWSLYEFDGSEPAGDDTPQGLLLAGVDADIVYAPGTSFFDPGFPDARRHPALTSLEPRAPPA